MELLTTSELAEKLKVAEGTIRNWVSKKKIPYVKLHKSVRFDETKIENWVNQRIVRPKTITP